MTAKTKILCQVFAAKPVELDQYFSGWRNGLDLARGVDHAPPFASGSMRAMLTRKVWDPNPGAPFPTHAPHDWHQFPGEGVPLSILSIGSLAALFARDPHLINDHGKVLFYGPNDYRVRAAHPSLASGLVTFSPDIPAWAERIAYYFSNLGNAVEHGTHFELSPHDPRDLESLRKGHRALIKSAPREMRSRLEQRTESQIEKWTETLSRLVPLAEKAVANGQGIYTISAV